MKRVEGWFLLGIAVCVAVLGLYGCPSPEPKCVKDEDCHAADPKAHCHEGKCEVESQEEKAEMSKEPGASEIPKEAQEPLSEATEVLEDGSPGEAPAEGKEPEAPAFPRVPCSRCFPIEDLPASLQEKAKVLLLKAFDQEALYSLAADIKPMSTGFAESSFPVDRSDTREADELKAIMVAFQCTEEIQGAMQVFTTPFRGRYSTEGVVFHLPRFRENQRKYKDLFQALKATEEMAPLEVVDRVDADPTTKRFRAYGHLFGYPAYAVDFFVQAAEEEDRTGKFVERDFVSIPTWESATNQFVYAVPKGHQENDADRELKAKAAPVLASYRKRRERYIGQGKAGILALIREWYNDGSDQCSPRHLGYD